MKEGQDIKGLDMPGVIVLLLDTKGVVKHINDNGCAIMGYARKAVIGKNWFDSFVPPGESKAVKKVYLKAMSSRIDFPGEFENPVLRKDKSPAIIQWRNSVIRGPKGLPVNGLFTGVDVTEKREFEKRLIAKEKYSKLRAAIWKLAADRSLTEKELIKKVVNVCGPDMSVDRACYNSIENGRMECTVEWKVKAVKSSLGGGVPLKLAEKYIPDGIIVYSPENIIKLFPRGIGGISAPFVKAIFKRFNIRSILGAPIYCGGSLAGTITFDICNNNRMKDGWSEEDREIISDIQNIISSVISLKQSEALRGEGEEKYRHIFDGIKEMVYIMELKKPGAPDRIIEANESLKKTLGYTMEELRSMGPEDLDCSGNKGINFLKLRGEIAGKGGALLERKMKAKNGRVFPAELSLKLIRLEGRQVGLVSIRDISVRREKDERISESEARFKAIYENAPEPYLIYDTKANIVDANKAAERLTGFSIEENRGKNMFKIGLLLKEDIPTIVKNLASRASGKYLGNIEYRFRTRNGEIIPVELISSDININGRKLLLAFVRDLRQRKKSDELLRAGEEKFRQIFDYAPDAYFIMDLKGTFLEGNIAAEKMIGYSKSELVGKSFFDLGLISPDQFAKATKDIIINASGKISGPTSYELTRREGTKVFMEAVAYPIKREGKTVLLGIARDITKRKKEERERDVLRVVSELFLMTEDLDSIFAVLPHIISERFGYPVAAINLYDREKEEMIFVGNEGITERHETLRVPAKESVSAEVIRTGKPVMIKDVSKHKRDLHQSLKKLGVKLFMAAPIKADKRVIGTLQIADRHDRPDADRIYSLLQAVTNYLSQEINRKQVQEALRKSEEKYRIVANFTHDWEYWVNEQGRFNYCSPSCERLTGYKPEEFFGDPELRLKIVHPEDREKYAGHLRKPTDSPPDSMDFRIIRKDGKKIWINHTCTPVFSDKGEPMGRRVSDRDISERIELSRVLEQSEMKFRELFNNASDAIFLHSIKSSGAPGKFIEVNETACKMLGYTKEEMLSMSPGDINSPEYTKKMPDIMARLIASGHETFDALHVSKGGREIPVEINAHIFDLMGERVVLSLARDISERVLAEAALKESEEKYRSLFSNMRNAFAYHRIITDSNGRPEDYEFLEINNAFERLTGLKRQAILGKSVRQVMPDILNESLDWIGTYGRVALTGEPANFESYNHALGRWFSVSAYSNTKEYFAVIFEDVTERKLAEENIKESFKKLKELDALKSDFTAMVSHELRTPLTSIKGYAYFLSGGIAGPLNEKQKEFVGSIQASSERLLSLINEVLDISKIESGTFSIVKKENDMVAIINNAAKDLKPLAAARNIEISLKGAVKASAMVDADRISQVIMNLINNSIKFSFDNSVIFVDTNIVDISEVRLPAYAGRAIPLKGSFVRVCVRDEGIGIEQDNLQRIFERFFQVSDRENRAFRGVGLGLSISKSIIESHGGVLWVESEGKGKGSSFYILIPA